MTGPVIVGGSGHSGTRVVAEILEANGVFMGVPRITRKRHSYDLFLKDKLKKWVEPYINGALDDAGLARMRREFRTRLRLYFPLRNRPWGFKNPRTLFILPVLHDIFPDMRFIHVVRDGRDMSFGNEFVLDNSYASAYLTAEEATLSGPEKMILFWGRSNMLTHAYCREHMPRSSIMVRFEELCETPEKVIRDMLRACDLESPNLSRSQALVHKPKSVGRWRRFDDDTTSSVEDLGRSYLEDMGYAYSCVGSK